MPLTPKQENFCLAYLETGNASEAYRRSYSAAAMKPETVNRKAKDLVDNGNIAARIAELRAPALQKAQLTHERVMQEVARIAFFDIRKLYDGEGNPVPIHLLDDDTAAAVAALDIMEEFDNGPDGKKLIGYTKKYKLNSKNDALTMAMRHLGMFNDKIDVNVTDALAERLARARAK